MYKDYRVLLTKNIEDLRQKNGVFRASSSEEYNYTWIRDNFWNNLSYLNDDIEKYIQTCHTHLDFLKKYEFDYDHKISWLIKDTNVHGCMSNMKRFIHPKVNFDGTEVEGLQWNFIQLDTLPYYILMMYKAWERGVNPFRDEVDKQMIQLIIKVIESMDICNKHYGASWEEELAEFTSNIGLCMRALEAGYDMGMEVDKEYLRKVRRKFWGQFPYERNGRETDLTLLFLCMFDILKPVDIENVVQNVERDLVREHGVARYKHDVYKPFTRDFNCNDHRQPCQGEMQWLMGNAYLSYIYSKLGNVEKAKYYLDKNVKIFPDGLIPEGVNEKGESCVNTPLCWSMSTTKLAIDAINGEFIN